MKWYDRLKSQWGTAAAEPARQWYFAVLVCILVFSQAACSQETVRPTSGAAGEMTSEAAARQLRVFRDSLYQGSNEEIRVDAAVGLLLENDNQSHNILLSALASVESSQARVAVCKALIKSQGLNGTIDSLEIFKEPLLEILRGDSVEEANLAAEALLMFEYPEVADVFEQILADAETDRYIRLNVVNALRLRSEPKALRCLIRSLDDPDAEVAKAAEAALQDTFGIPVGTGRDEWSAILEELKLKTPEEIQKKQLLNKSMKLSEAEKERERWKKLYLASLDKQYESADDTARGKVILESMGSDLKDLRIWALEKVSTYSVVEEPLRDTLFSMLSDDSRDVRLQAAMALMNMSALNPVSVLLDRMPLEDDHEVRLAMLEALGEACFFAFSPGSAIELANDAKVQTLEFAVGYLQSSIAEDSIKGAEVIRKMLELNNLSNKAMESYLTLLHTRYRKSVAEGGPLRAALLANLAHLCGQGGAKEPSCALFESLFAEVIVAGDDDPALRLAAVQGLSYVDKAESLELFKKHILIGDESLAVQQVVVDVAGQVGDASDLEWLLGLLGVNGHTENAWEAIISICQRQDAKFLVQWRSKLEAAEGVSDDEVREILEISEQKAAGEKNTELQVQIQEEILGLLVGKKSWSNALTYLEKIAYDLDASGFTSATNASVLKIFLYSKDADNAAVLLQAKLKQGDVSLVSPMGAVLKDYFSDEAIGDEDKALVFNKIKDIKVQERPSWSDFISGLSIVSEVSAESSEETDVQDE